MQPAELIKYIQNPSLLDKESVKHLQKLVHDFPYFQSAHVLLSMASRKWDASIYQQSLKKTAIVTTNRAHLFKLIHQVENEVPVASSNQQGEVVEAKQKVDTHQEDSKQELDILKATEISTEPVIAVKVEELESEPLEKKEIEQEIKVKPVLNAEEILEREIGKEVVNSFVEKEILKTPELNKTPVKVEDPESFADWLSFLKKNNGQSYKQIEEQVSFEKAKQDAKHTPVVKAEKTAEVQEKDSDSVVNPKEEVQARKLKNKAIIDKIIESSPGIIRQKEEQRFYAPDIKAKESLLENEHLVTETLAKIYALQGSVNKAIRAYEILSIKSPQKRAYYDGLIQKLKNNA
ncbi:hypothetical protein CNR22_17425 [Sphingobacteriaceae bacterium]|nr:hypothetical protein CNR22_17425 [Sphingobacteriaceae bacterium]